MELIGLYGVRYGEDLINKLQTSFCNLDMPIYLLILIHGKTTEPSVFMVKRDAIDGDFDLYDP